MLILSDLSSNRIQSKSRYTGFDRRPSVASRRSVVGIDVDEKRALLSYVCLLGAREKKEAAVHVHFLTYLGLDGSTVSLDREQLVTSFNSPANKKVYVFLLSTKYNEA